MIIRQNNYYNKTKNSNLLKYDSWNEWFAGIVDGNGYFYINKKNEISFELTTSIIDIRILYNIKNKLNKGSIKIRSGSTSVRYRVKQKQIILQILNIIDYDHVILLIFLFYQLIQIIENFLNLF